MPQFLWSKVFKPSKNIATNVGSPDIYSFKLDYKDFKTELCDIGAFFDSDKSSQRNNVTNERHCHPYTILYNAIFSCRRNDTLNIAEIGILHGASVNMWRHYFGNATIFGFEYNKEFISDFKNKYDTNRVVLNEINVKDSESIQTALKTVGTVYDIIIEDSTHQFEDQIRVVENIHPYLKPGGILIIEDIFKHYSESNYIDRLNALGILSEFQKCYFIELDHARRNSYGWNNDKVLLLVKKGGDANLSGTKMTIITPSYRTDRLETIKQSLDFNYINKWVIVHDATKIKENPMIFDSEKIEEHLYSADGISGNDQRNYALDQIGDDSFVYFLDDDNLIHRDLYKLLDIIDSSAMYTFDQNNRLKGNTIKVNAIDSAMCLVKKGTCKDLRWSPDKYNADGYYMTDAYALNKDKWVYVNNTLAHYNALN